MSWLLVSDRLTSAVAQALTTNTLFTQWLVGNKKLKLVFTPK